MQHPERWKMLVSIPFWGPLALIACGINWVFHPESVRYYWNELKDIIKWAWKN